MSSSFRNRSKVLGFEAQTRMNIIMRNKTNPNAHMTVEFEIQRLEMERNDVQYYCRDRLQLLEDLFLEGLLLEDLLLEDLLLGGLSLGDLLLGDLLPDVSSMSGEPEASGIFMVAFTIFYFAIFHEVLVMILLSDFT